MSKTLLLADDSVVIQKLVGLSFANEDVELVTTDNGDDAIAKAREVKPDVVLADVVMPGKNGYEVCEAIRAEPTLQHTPVLLLTGTFEAFDEERARSVGSNGHITKPFEAQALVTRVNELLAEAATSDMASTSPTAGDAGFDFFDEDANELADGAGLDRTVTAPPRPGAPSASPSVPSAMEQSFDFGTSGDDLGLAADADVLDDSLGLDDSFGSGGSLSPGGSLSLGDDGPEVGGEHTVALIDDELDPMSAAPAAAELLGRGPSLLDDLHADDVPDALSVEDDDDADADVAGTTVLSEDGFAGGLNTRLDTSAPAPGSLTTVIMSDGASSSDGIALGDPGNDVTDLDELEDERGATAPDVFAQRSPSPADTVLADDLFDDSMPAATPPLASPAPPSSTAELDDAFDFGRSRAAFDDAEDPRATSGTALLADRDASAPIFDEPDVNGVSGYDVSSSDLGDPFALPPSAPADRMDDDVAFGGTDEPAWSAAEPPASPPVTRPDPTPVADGASGATPDISPVLRDRIHDTLERVAWEAFSDLSETMVKQVLERVESIAWEVIPQMAEALVKEEIRRMKGEDES